MQACGENDLLMLGVIISWQFLVKYQLRAGAQEITTISFFKFILFQNNFVAECLILCLIHSLIHCSGKSILVLFHIYV